MSGIIIDRRKNDGGKSTVNRQKFVKRVKEAVRQSVKKAIRDGNIKDLADSNGKKIIIPDKGLSQPNIHHDDGGVYDRVYPGNKNFRQGDRVKRPKGGGGGAGGKDGSHEGEGEDAFEFHLTREEFLEIFFEDLELPDLSKKDISTIDEYHYKRAGFSPDGPPNRLNVLRTMKQAKGRRFALRAGKRGKLKKLLKLVNDLELIIDKKTQLNEDCTSEQNHKKKILEEIIALKKQLKAIPFIDDVDLRYNRWDKVPTPTTQAVMFCLMDVSWSMGEWEKEMSKRFFMLLYLFLLRNYERVDIVFIRHTTIAKEVDEHEFFHSKETGGTIVSSALEEMKKIADERYPTSLWNIFACQCSDGDNFDSDNHHCIDLLQNQILPITQYYAYVEIDQTGTKDSSLWPQFETVKANHKNFEMAHVSDVTEIYPVFRGLFKKREGKIT